MRILGFLFLTVTPRRFTTSGNCGVAILTRFCTSSVATSILVPTANMALIVTAPLLVLLLCRYCMPGEPFIWASIGVAIVCSTVSASAPVNAPVTCTVAGVISGYCPTARFMIQIVPTISKTMEITIAVTGRFINTSAIISF